MAWGSMSTSGLGHESLLCPRRVGAPSPRVNAICGGRRLNLNLRLESCTQDGPLGNADVDVGGARRDRDELLRDRQLELQIAAVAEPQLRPRREHERQRAVAREYL